MARGKFLILVTTSVIVPVWNRADLTNAFLYKNWLLYRDKLDVEFIIVNNGSADSTKAILVQWQDRMGEQLKVITSPDNLGFSGGNNLGVQHSEADILIFTSNDVLPTGDYVSIVVESVDNDLMALFGAELLSHNTGWNTFHNHTIPYIAGHFITTTSKIWDTFLQWDERYFPCDYEDIDLSMQAIEKELRLIPLKLPILHASGQSAKNIDGGRLAITLKNKVKFMEKWGLVE